MRFQLALTAALATTQVTANLSEFFDTLEQLAVAFNDDPEGFLTAAQNEIMAARNMQIDQNEQDLAYLQGQLEMWWEMNVGERAAAVPAVNLAQDDWAPVQELIDVINAIGEDPSEFMTQQREAYIAKLRRDIDSLDVTLTYYRCGLLAEFDISCDDEPQDMCQCDILQPCQHNDNGTCGKYSYDQATADLYNQGNMCSAGETDCFSQSVPALNLGDWVNPNFDCDSGVNWMNNGPAYNQISLTDGCDSAGVCDRNPVYGSTNNNDQARQYCEDKCTERQTGGQACEGFFFQKHNNGHEICGFYASGMAGGQRVWGGHQAGAICQRASWTYGLVESGDCTGSALIETADECQAAIAAVFNVNDAQVQPWSTPSYARGCFKYNYGHPGSQAAYDAPTSWVYNAQGGPGTSGHCTAEPGYAACVCRTGGVLNLNSDPTNPEAYAEVVEVLEHLGDGNLNLQSCTDTSNGATDAYGDVCDWYAGYPDYCGSYDDDDFAASSLCCACGGGSTASGPEPLASPEWAIDLDYDQAEVYATDLAAAYDDLEQRMMHTWTDWQTDRDLVDQYYWNYELLPLLEEGAALDERTTRTLITWVVEGTQVKGKPLKDVFPEVEAWMLENYDSTALSLQEKLGMNRMPVVLQEWYAADWFDYMDCVKENAPYCEYEPEYAMADCLEPIYQDTCDWYDTYADDFYTCIWSLGEDCDGMYSWAVDNTDESYWADNADYDYALWLQEIPSTPTGPVTFSFFFDPELVNAWFEKEGQNYEMLGNMYNAEWEAYAERVTPLWNQINQVNQEFDARFREIDAELEGQLNDSFYDIGAWLEGNFAAEEAQYVTLAAKVQTKRSNTDVMMYAAVAIASLAVVSAILYKKTQKKEERAFKHDQVVESLVGQA